MEDQLPLPDDGVSSGLRKLEAKTQKDPQDELEEAKADFARAQTESLREATRGVGADRKIRTWLVPSVVIVSLITIAICLYLTVLAAFGRLQLSASIAHIIDAGFIASSFSAIGAILHSFLRRK